MEQRALRFGWLPAMLLLLVAMRGGAQHNLLTGRGVSDIAEPRASQDGAPSELTISGRVTDSAGKPIGSASIWILALHRHALSLDDGSYTLSVPAKELRGTSDSIVVMLVGYARTAKSVMLSPHAARRDFVLRRQPLVLEAAPNATFKESSDWYGYGERGAMKSAGLRPLGATHHPRGEREIRVWLGVSIATPKDALRLVNRDGVVTGELIYWWQFPNGASWEKWRRETLTSAPRWCTRIHFEGEFGTCRARFSREPDWSAVWASLEARGVLRPRDPSLTKSPYYIQNDGLELTVETWDGKAYHEWSPAPGMSQIELDRGADLTNVVSQIARQAVDRR